MSYFGIGVRAQPVERMPASDIYNSTGALRGISIPSRMYVVKNDELVRTVSARNGLSECED